MRGLLYLILIGAFLYSGYWVAGSTAQSTALNTWLEQQRARGWLAEASDIKVQGYPNRFDATIFDLQLSDRISDWAWEAPSFQILALSYQPNHIIAAWPGKQRIYSSFESIDVTSDLMRGSVRFAPNTGLALQETRIELKNVEIASTLDYTGGLKDGFLVIRRNETDDARDFTYNVNFSATEFRLAEPIKEALDPTNFLPAALESMRLDLVPVYDGGWDRAAIEGRRPQLTELGVPELSITWGALEFTLKGKLNVDAQGYGEGRMTLEAKNWQEIIALAVRAGWMEPSFAEQLETWLSTVALASGNEDALNIPLTFEDGLAKLGPVLLIGSFEIGRAPLLVHLQ